MNPFDTLRARITELESQLAMSVTYGESLKADCERLKLELTRRGVALSHAQNELEVLREDKTRIDNLTLLRGRFMYFENHTEKWLDFTNPRRCLDLMADSEAIRKARHA